MFEILERGGLGRTGLWTRGGRSLSTPLVLSLHRPSAPALSAAEALLVEERTEDPRLQIRVSGTFFAPKEPASPDDLPPSRGLPHSVADLEIPQPPILGDLAILTSGEDVAAAAHADAVFLAHGPEFARDPRAFVAAVTRARQSLGPAKVLGIFGLAAPGNLAALVYAGADLVDSSRVVLDGARGVFHTSDGTGEATDAARAACGCPACSEGGSLRMHNERALYREVLLVRDHLARGRLRELVERRLANDPWNTAVVRHLDLRAYDLVEESTPVSGGELLAYSHESLTRPEILRFRRRLRERYSKPPSARVLLLLPCSARKPYSTSRSHRKFRDAVLAAGHPTVVHEVVVTSPLGLIPRELERFHPARAYDIPVTGDWNRDEAAMVSGDLQAYVAANPYDAIVAHLGAEAPIVHEALPQALLPIEDRPTSDEALRALARTLADVTSSLERVPGSRRFAEEMTNAARFQFGDAGRALLDGATFRGRFPDVRAIRGGTQVASFTERGMWSLTLEGGRILSDADAYSVEIEDFEPKGNVFAVGVTAASREIRVGDDVVVRHAGDVRAVGTARLSWREMVDSQRGEAVHVRHARTPKA